MVWGAQMLRFEISAMFDQIFQTTNPALRVIKYLKYLKYDPGLDLFDLRAVLLPCVASIVVIMGSLARGRTGAVNRI
jgi:hypothetical protein